MEIAHFSIHFVHQAAIEPVRCHSFSLMFQKNAMLTSILCLVHTLRIPNYRTPQSKSPTYTDSILRKKNFECKHTLRLCTKGDIEADNGHSNKTRTEPSV